PPSVRGPWRMYGDLPDFSAMACGMPACNGGFVMPSAIEEHGVIGNLRTVALVATNGAIDWCCLPNFDSPSVFGALLDDARGGHFQISPTVDKLRTRQTYLPDTNILITRFLHADGVCDIVGLIPVHQGASSDRPARPVRRAGS